MSRITVMCAALVACGGGSVPDETAGGGAPLSWLAGRWSGEAGKVSEDWRVIGAAMVGVGFGVEGGVTRSFEIMTVSARKEGTLVFTARPEGGRPVDFPQESRGDTWVVFANPEHDFPKKVAYHADGDRLVAHVEGDRGGKDWMLTRGGAAPPVAELERAAVAAGRSTRSSGVSPAGDSGFTIEGGARGADIRVTMWRRERGAWSAVGTTVIPAR